MQNITLSGLSDRALLEAVQRLARTEHDATLALVHHLAELGARKLYLGAGFSSLFEYCRVVLSLSEGEAYNRVIAARAVRSFPLTLELLRNGSLNLTTIRLLYKHLTVENHRELLEEAVGKSKRDVERLVAARFPQPAAPFSVRKLPMTPSRARIEASQALPTVAGEATALTSLGSSVDVPRPGQGAAVRVPAPVPAGPTVPTSSRSVRPATIAPITEDQYSVKFTARATTWEKLQAAQDLLRHSLPSGEVSEIFDRALTLLLEDLARKKFAATTRPRASQGTKPGSRDIAAAVRRAVWVRDCARCAFVSASGRRCAERGRLEFHHRHPFGAGGEGTVSNIELRCSGHNLYEAELFYGPMREGAATVREASPEWDVSPVVSTDAIRLEVDPGSWDWRAADVSHRFERSFAKRANGMRPPTHERRWRPPTVGARWYQRAREQKAHRLILGPHQAVTDKVD